MPTKKEEKRRRHAAIAFLVGFSCISNWLFDAVKDEFLKQL